MRKLIIVYLFLFLPFYVFSQTLHFFGKVYERTNDFTNQSRVKETLRPAKRYSIYLLTEDQSKSKAKLVLKSDTAAFSFAIKKKGLKKYRYFEFVNAFSNFVISIDSAKKDSLIIVMEPQEMILKKPAIYLYPSQKQEITIKHFFKGEILNTYPVYENAWHVIAEPDGKIFNISDGRTYNYLFWDGKCAFPSEHYNFAEGFYVRKENTVEFLQKTLAEIGLSNTEINDFIVYWLPALNKNGDNLIRFAVNDNIFGTSFLDVTPKPDTEIRVFMEFRKTAASGKSDLPEQKLPKIERKGFTLVEWGGSEAGTDILE